MPKLSPEQLAAGKAAAIKFITDNGWGQFLHVIPDVELDSFVETIAIAIVNAEGTNA